MAISRVQKFKEYRNSLIKEEAPDLKTPKSASKELNIESKEEYDTTSTLPMDQVMENMENDGYEEAVYKKRRNQLILKYVLIGAGAAIIIAVLVIVGILLWR